MTTIAYRDGWIACDSGITCGGTRDMFTDKIAKNARGHLCGAAGAVSWISDFLTWFKDGENGTPPVNHDPDRCFAALVIRKPREIWQFDSKNGKTGSFKMYGPYVTTGSGQDVALGAMYAGASARAAVEAAIRHDCGTFGKIQALKLGK